MENLRWNFLKTTYVRCWLRNCVPRSLCVLQIFRGQTKTLYLDERKHETRVNCRVRRKTFTAWNQSGKFRAGVSDNDPARAAMNTGVEMPAAFNLYLPHQSSNSIRTTSISRAHTKSSSCCSWEHLLISCLLDRFGKVRNSLQFNPDKT